MVTRLGATGPGAAQSQVSGWGNRIVGSGWYQEQFTGIAAGGEYMLAIKTDGSIGVGWNQQQRLTASAPANFAQFGHHDRRGHAHERHRVTEPRESPTPGRGDLGVPAPRLPPRGLNGSWSVGRGNPTAGAGTSGCTRSHHRRSRWRSRWPNRS